jgi:hypothetical protein
LASLPEPEAVSGKNVPTKLSIRFTLDEDPLFRFEDSRLHSRAAQFHLERSKADYIAELEIINIKSVKVFLESNRVECGGASILNEPARAKFYISLHRPCPVLKIYA